MTYDKYSFSTTRPQPQSILVHS